MRKLIVATMALALAMTGAAAQSFVDIPFLWKWVSNSEVVFSRDFNFSDDSTFSVSVPGYRVTEGVKAPEKYASLPVKPARAANPTFSPDSTKIAFTRDNDLWVVDIESKKETRLTFDGSALILNGYASWVYYEEILGRPSRYRAFWWSPDSQKIGFYRFDNTNVPMFPIYSPYGSGEEALGGHLSLTRYPKAGQANPEVRIGMTDLAGNIVWADFDEKQDQYFGIPFWSADSKYFYIAREPRIQNTLDLYAVSAADGSKKAVYHEKVDTWLEWIEGMVFTEKGLYMARDFETGYEQIYFLSYDGKELRRLTSGPNWRVNIVRVDEKAGDVYYLANRDATTKAALYKVDKAGEITALTDPSLNAQLLSFSPDGRHFVVSLSNYTTPTQVWVYETATANLAWKTRNAVAAARKTGRRISQRYASSCYKVADMKGPDYNAADYALPQHVTITTEDGFTIPGAITYPKGFDPSRKYPVHVDLYGGPNTASVKDRWVTPSERNQWWSDNGIIEIVIDARGSGHNGRAGLDQLYCNLIDKPIKDFVAWAEWLKSQPYVIADKIGVEGFSFGGTMTTMLLCEHSDAFHYGIAGGGVYDWALYDTHYTERFMETPQTNPEGYKAACVLNHLEAYPVRPDSDDSVMLKITHGTGDDNVHFQNTLRLIDGFQKLDRKFELMIYPDGLHGYRGYQGKHSLDIDRDFWKKYLLGE